MACPTNGSGCSFGIGLWASGFWQELNSPPNLSALTLSGYACSQNTIGRLNNLVGTCFMTSGATTAGTVDFTVVPDLTYQELTLIGAMYLVSYYNGLAQSAMGAGGVINSVNGGTPVQMISEGDSRIQWANVAGIGRNYADMAKQAKLDLNYIVNAYIRQTQGSDTPRTVTMPLLVTPQIGGGWGAYGA